MKSIVVIFNAMKYESVSKPAPKYAEINTSLLKAIVLSATAVSVIGIFQFVTLSDFIPQVAPPASTFANKNFAAAFIILVFPVTIYFSLSYKTTKPFWFNFKFYAVLQLTYVLFAHSKASILAVSTEIILMAFLFMSIEMTK